MASFAELRKKNDPLAAMQAKLKTEEKGKSNRNGIEDDTFWTMDHLRGEDGTGFAEIRLLPACDGEDDPWVKWFEHVFQGREHWYSNRSRMSLGSQEKDPVYEFNGKIFRDKSLSDEARKKKLLPRRENIISNIQVINDPNKPENNGKVFRWKYGPQIFGIINAAAFPKFGDKPIPVFDPFDGANLMIRVTTKMANGKPVPSYEKSSFNAPSALCSEDEFEAIWAKQYPLQPLIASKEFVPYPELKLRFDLVMGDIDQDEYDRGMEQLKEGIMARKSSEAPSKKAEQAETPAAAGKTFKEEVNDDIPFGGSDPVDESEGDDTPLTTLVSGDDAADDDWFAGLKK